MSHFDPLTHNTLNDPTTEDIQESMQKLENVQSSVYSQEDGMVSYKDFNPTLTFEEGWCCSDCGCTISTMCLLIIPD